MCTQVNHDASDANLAMTVGQGDAQWQAVQAMLLGWQLPCTRDTGLGCMRCDRELVAPRWWHRAADHTTHPQGVRSTPCLQ